MMRASRKTENPQPHDVPGQLNIFVLDKDDVVTGYGSHERVVGFEPQYHAGLGCNIRYCRIDKTLGLPVPTDKQIIKVLRQRPINAKGRLKVHAREEWLDNESIEVLVKCG